MTDYSGLKCINMDRGTWGSILLGALLLFIQIHAVNGFPPLLRQETWGGSGEDVGKGITVDSSNNIYIAGYTNSEGFGLRGGADLLLLAFNSSGNLKFATTWGDRDSEQGSAVAVDDLGNILVAGSNNLSRTPDSILLKFDRNGYLIWRFAWGGNGSDVATGIALDNSGNIYLTGYTNSSGAGGNDVFILKLDTNGSMIWQRTWGGWKSDVGSGITVDFSGDIYVTGTTESSGAGESDILILKLNSTGSLLWEEEWGGIYADSGQAIALSNTNDVFVTGYTLGDEPGFKLLLLKLDASGNILYAKKWGGNNNDYGLGVASDSLGNMYVTGFSTSFTANPSAPILKVQSDGSLQYAETWGGTFGATGYGITVDSSGNPLITGFVYGPPTPVSETVNITFQTPTGFLTVYGNNSLGISSYIASIPNGFPGSPLGSETYAGGWDLFLVRYNTNSASLEPFVVILVMVIASLILKGSRGGKSGFKSAKASSYKPIDDV